jgi:hypothetical protein
MLTKVDASTHTNGLDFKAGPPSRPQAASARSRHSSPEFARAEADAASATGALRRVQGCYRVILAGLAPLYLNVA